jgi:hypothetical protein
MEVRARPHAAYPTFNAADFGIGDPLLSGQLWIELDDVMAYGTETRRSGAELLNG